MSRAFTKEEAPSGPVLIPPRAPLPPGAKNYVTPRGLDLLHAERTDLERERAALDADGDDEDERKRALAVLAGRLADLNARIASARVIAHDPVPDEVRFGATVTLATATGEERRFTIVGVDEAGSAPDRVAFLAPIARAVTGHKVGDTIPLKTPRGDESLTVTAISYEWQAGEAPRG
jgi:transcription elongation factor GreB